MRPLLLALAALACGGPALAQSHWVTTPADGCVGLTVAWPASITKLRELVAPQWEPLPVATDAAQGGVAIFVMTCTGGRVDGAPAGATALALPIVPLAGARTPGVAPARSAIPIVVGDTASAAFAAFRKSGFVVGEATVTLRVRREARGYQAIAAIATDSGRIVIEAEIDDSTDAFQANGALAAAGPGATGRLGGPESSVRLAKATATVTSEGSTWLSRLGVTPYPERVYLDTRFVWDFTFQAGVP